MLFSVITICRNCKSTITDTVQSVLQQSYRNFEYIIVDGKSHDGTIEVIRSYKNHIKLIISEPLGIYAALNEGISKASGDYIVFVHGGDRFAADDVLSNLASCIKVSDVDLIFGGKEYLSSDRESVLRTWIPGNHSRFKWLMGWMPPHLGCIFKREVYMRYGGFDSSYSISGDYEFLLRVMYRYNSISMKRISKIIVQMGPGGVSHSSFSNIVRSNREVLRAWKENCSFTPYWIFLFKPLSKLMQINWFGR